MALTGCAAIRNRSANYNSTCGRCSSGGTGSSSGGGSSPVYLDGKVVECLESFFGSRVDGEDHPLSAVGAGSLLAVPPSGSC